MNKIGSFLIVLTEMEDYGQKYNLLAYIGGKL